MSLSCSLKNKLGFFKIPENLRLLVLSEDVALHRDKPEMIKSLLIMADRLSYKKAKFSET